MTFDRWLAPAHLAAMADLWLKGDYPIGPFPHPPIEQAVADVLAKAPWSGFSTGDVGFRHDFVDRPEGAYD